MARGWPRIRLLSGAGVGEIPDGHRWDAPPKVRFARDSPLEEMDSNFRFLVSRASNRHRRWDCCLKK